MQFDLKSIWGQPWGKLGKYVVNTIYGLIVLSLWFCDSYKERIIFLSYFVKELLHILQSPKSDKPLYTFYWPTPKFVPSVCGVLTFCDKIV